MEKQTEKALRIFLYTIVTILVLSITTSLLFPIFVGAIFAKLGENLNGNKIKMEKRINVENERKRNEIVMKSIEKPKENKEVILAKPKKFEGTIYSWTNEKGNKIYSNIGFPKDGKYTNGKIEMR